MPTDPLARFRGKEENPVAELRGTFRAFQADALQTLVEGKGDLQGLSEMMERVSSLVGKACEGLRGHPRVTQEEVATFQEGVERTLTVYRGKLAAKVMDSSDPKLENVCLYIEKHRSDLLEGAGVIPPFVTGVPYPIVVKQGKISVQTGKGVLPYPFFN